MRSYYKVFHYSSQVNLSIIDPRYYGSGLQRTKDREGGLNKSYFYTTDHPESCIASRATRYEVYLPCNWKNLIYDFGANQLDIYEKALSEFKKQYKREPYEYEIKEYVEKYLSQLGYVGFENTQCSQLANVLVLFVPITTKTPESPRLVCNWSGEIVEKIGHQKENNNNVLLLNHGLFSVPATSADFVVHIEDSEIFRDRRYS